MKRYLNFIKNKLGLLGAITIAALAGGLTSAVVLAAIPDSSSTIHGCYTNSTGTLKVIDSENGGVCASGETSLNWNQTGPQGPAGESAGGQITSKNLTLNYGEADNQPILNLPNFGEVAVFTCEAGSGGLQYINTTAHDVDDNSTLTAPNDNGPAGPTVILGYSDGSTNYTATVTSSTRLDSDSGNCNFQAQAIVSQN